MSAGADLCMSKTDTRHATAHHQHVWYMNMRSVKTLVLLHHLVSRDPVTVQPKVEATWDCSACLLCRVVLSPSCFNAAGGPRPGPGMPQLDCSGRGPGHYDSARRGLDRRDRGRQGRCTNPSSTQTQLLASGRLWATSHCMARPAFGHCDLSVYLEANASSRPCQTDSQVSWPAADMPRH